MRTVQYGVQLFASVYETMHALWLPSFGDESVLRYIPGYVRELFPSPKGGDPSVILYRENRRIPDRIPGQLAAALYAN
jgi:hypothetical protein